MQTLKGRLIIAIATASVTLVLCLGVSAPRNGGRVGLMQAAKTPAADAQTIADEEKEGSSYAAMADQFRKAARVAADEEHDARQKGAVDTLADAAEKLDWARGHLSSAADRAGLEHLATSLKAYSRALLRNKDGLEFESPSAYKHLSNFELKHPSLARIRNPLRATRRRVEAHSKDSMSGELSVDEAW